MSNLNTIETLKEELANKKSLLEETTKNLEWKQKELSELLFGNLDEISREDLKEKIENAKDFISKNFDNFEEQMNNPVIKKIFDEAYVKAGMENEVQPTSVEFAQIEETPSFSEEMKPISFDNLNSSEENEENKETTW